METTKTSGSAKETNNAITDMYSSQMNRVTGFYTNFFNAIMGGNNDLNQHLGYKDMLQSNNQINTFSNPFFSSFEKVYSQLADYNRNLFGAFQLDAAMETSKKVIGEMHTQFGSVIRQSQKFWSEVLHLDDVAPVKEPTPGELKRKANIPAPELMDHQKK